MKFYTIQKTTKSLMCIGVLLSCSAPLWGFSVENKTGLGVKCTVTKGGNYGKSRIPLANKETWTWNDEKNYTFSCSYLGTGSPNAVIDISLADMQKKYQIIDKHRGKGIEFEEVK